MFYYAEINSEYQVINKHCLSEESTNPNYILITEDLYTNGNELGDIVGQFYNTLSGVIEIVHPDWDMGQTCWMRYKDGKMRLSTKLDNMDKATSLKADIDHIHEGYANADDLQALEDVVSTKANANHIHTEYAPVTHSHSEYALQTSVNALEMEIDGKADFTHSHTEYALSTHEHNEYAEVGHNHNSDYAPLSHSHTEYVITADFNALETEVDGKANENHIHDNYATVSDFNELSSVVSGKANAVDLNSHVSDTEIHISESEREYWNTKSDFSGSYNDLSNKPAIPSIDGLATEDYVDDKVGAITVESIGALPNTTVIPAVPTNVSAFTNDAGYLTEHQSLAGLATETYVNTQINAIDIPSALSDLTTDSTHRVVTDVEKATWNAKSDFSGSYNDLTNKPSIPSISGLATETYVDEAVSTKADSGHTHGDIYYTETEVNSLLATKSDSTHNHDTSYDSLGSASSALTSAKAYVDELIADEVANRDSAIATAKSSAISTAASDATTKANNALASAKTYADSVGVTVKNDLLNGAGEAYNTLKELGDLIDENVDAIEALEAVAAGKANATHTHAISDITNLQSTLDGKAASSHGTHVTYSTTAPVMDGTASVGTASTVARSDHKHPTDTSRAAQTDLDALETVVAGKANASHTHTIANITNLQSTLDGKAASSHTHTVSNISDLTATATELNYMDGVTSNVQTQLDGKAALSHNHSATNITSGTLSSDRLPTVPITKGGTGATDRKGAINNLVFLGDNPIANTDDDTVANWSTLGNGYAWYTTSGLLISQPSQWGFLTNIVKSSDIWQIWKTQSNGAMYFRSGNSSGWGMTWRQIIDSSTIGSQSVNYATSAGTATTASNVAWSGVTSKPSYYDAKAIKSITRSGTTFTYTCMDGTTGTFTQQDNNTTYNNATTSTAGLMSATDKSKLDGIASGANAYTLPAAGSSLGGVKSGGDVTISSGTITVNDDSHNHVISNIDNLQSALDGKSATSHTHTAEALVAMAEALFGTNYLGGVEYSYGSGSGKNVLTEISNMPQGFHTIYSIAGTTGNPKTGDSWRMLVHKTSTTIGWILAFDAQGSVYSNYQSAANTFKGWRCLYDAAPSALWTGGYYMSSTNGTPQTVTPSKKLSECRNGWVLIWSDYDPDTSTKNNTDIHHDYVFKKNCAGANWSGQCMLCDIPRYMGSDSQDVDTERRILKAIYIHDDRIEGSYQGSYDERNDVILRAVYEF